MIAPNLGKLFYQRGQYALADKMFSEFLATGSNSDILYVAWFNSKNGKLYSTKDFLAQFATNEWKLLAGHLLRAGFYKDSLEVCLEYFNKVSLQIKHKDSYIRTLLDTAYAWKLGEGSISNKMKILHYASKVSSDNNWNILCMKFLLGEITEEDIEKHIHTDNERNEFYLINSAKKQSENNPKEAEKLVLISMANMTRQNKGYSYALRLAKDLSGIEK
jgi:hypothetical protein